MAQVERDKVRVCTKPVQILTQVSLQLRAESLTGLSLVRCE
jgi:hypothetical protein